MRMLTCREGRLFACLPACLQVGAAPVGAPRLAGDGLLREETCRGNHREAAVGELLLLHEAELLGARGLEAKRIEAQVARVVARAQRGLSLRLRAVELAEARLDAEGLRRADGTSHDDPEPDRELRDLIDRRAAVAREEGVELLLHEEAERGEHRNAAMGELGLAVAVDLELGLALEEAGRVEIARRAEVAREACTKGDASR